MRLQANGSPVSRATRDQSKSFGEERKTMKKIMWMLAIGIWACTVSVGCAAAVVDAGNKMCPVSGDDVEGKHFVEYKGKRYGLCCPMCANKFNKNPEKFLKEMEKGHQHHHHDVAH